MQAERVIIKDEESGEELGRFVSSQQITVREILDDIDGSDGVLLSKDNGIFPLDARPEAGTYTWRLKKRRRRHANEDGGEQLQQHSNSLSKRQKDLATYEPSEFNSPLETTMPVLFEKPDEIQPFLAPENWLGDTADIVLQQADLEESNSPRVSPVAVVGCSRGGKTRSFVELAREIRKKDDTYGIVYITFNSTTPLDDEGKGTDPMAELCMRIAFAASKDRPAPQDERRKFLEFSNDTIVSRNWVVNWLGDQKCILIVDEMNMLQESIGPEVANFLKRNFMLPSGRGLVFSSQVASFGSSLVAFMSSSPRNRNVITCPLPIIPSVYQARNSFTIPDLSPRRALFLGLIPGLIVEDKMRRQPTERRIGVVAKYLATVRSQGDVCKLLRSILTGEGVHVSLQELMTADLRGGDSSVFGVSTVILRWIPFHMHYVLQRIAADCPYIGSYMKKCLTFGIADLFQQFASAKWEGGDAWEALFLIVLLVRCLTGSFDNTVVPLSSFVVEDSIPVWYNGPLNKNVDSCSEQNHVEFVAGIPLRSWAEPGMRAVVSIYYPGHARFEAFDAILAFWDADGSRLLYGYQLKEGKTIPNMSSAFDNSVFHKSFVVRGQDQATPQQNRPGVRSVSDQELDNFFGVSADHWSAKRWKKLQKESS